MAVRCHSTLVSPDRVAHRRQNSRWVSAPGVVHLRFAPRSDRRPSVPGREAARVRLVQERSPCLCRGGPVPPPRRRKPGAGVGVGEGDGPPHPPLPPRPAPVGGRATPERPGEVRQPASPLRAGRTGQARDRVHPRPDAVPVGLLSRRRRGQARAAASLTLPPRGPSVAAGAGAADAAAGGVGGARGTAGVAPPGLQSLAGRDGSDDQGRSSPRSSAALLHAQSGSASVTALPHGSGVASPPTTSVNQSSSTYARCFNSPPSVIADGAARPAAARPSGPCTSCANVARW